MIKRNAAVYTTGKGSVLLILVLSNPPPLHYLQHNGKRPGPVTHAEDARRIQPAGSGKPRINERRNQSHPPKRWGKAVVTAADLSTLVSYHHEVSFHHCLSRGLVPRGGRSRHHDESISSTGRFQTHPLSRRDETRQWRVIPAVPVTGTTSQA